MITNKNDEDDTLGLEHQQRKVLLDWSHKQGRILTANGKSLQYYVKERGFPFQESELPHFHLLSGNNTFHTFRSWCQCQQDFKTRQGNNQPKEIQPNIVGAWTRTLFFGGWEHATDRDEITFNLQTHGLFIDMRIPRIAKKVMSSFDNNSSTPRFPKHQFYIEESIDDDNILASWTVSQLQYYARRHAFAGYTLREMDPHSHRMVCTRFHCMDWNFIGVPRPRPNKWYVEMHPDHENVWKEWSFAKDEYGQHYYVEQWERLEGDEYGRGVVVALRRVASRDNAKDGMWRDGILLVTGDHFAFIQGRRSLPENHPHNFYSKSTLVDLVDAALDAGDRKTVEYFLSIDAAHGRVSKGWMIDCSLRYWKEGMRLLDPSQIRVQGTSIDTCQVFIHNIEWEVYESSIRETRALQSFLQNKPPSDADIKSKL